MPYIIKRMPVVRRKPKLYLHMRSTAEEPDWTSTRTDARLFDTKAEAERAAAVLAYNGFGTRVFYEKK